MPSMKTENKSIERMPYEKPAMRSISLVADQVLGVGCKTSTDEGLPGSGNPGCTVNACYTAGS